MQNAAERDFMRKRFGSVLLLLLVALAGCDLNAAPPSDPGRELTPASNLGGELKIGAAAPLTGDTADGGIQIRQGAELAAAEWNAKGGLLGKRIVIVSADDQANPSQAAAVAGKLVSSQVVAVVGHKDSGLSIPASEIYDKAGIVMVSPTSSNPALTTRGLETVFRVCPMDTTQGPFLADYLVTKLQKKQIAVLYADTAYGQGLYEQFAKRATELGAAPVIAQQIHRGDRDFTTPLQAVAALAPDAVMYAGSVPEGIVIAQQMKEMNIRATFIGGDTLFQREFTHETGSAGEGAYVTSFFPDPLKDDDTKAWVERYRALFKRNPGGNSLGGYVAALTLLEAIKKANSTDPAAVLAAMRNLQFDSFIGPIAFDDKGDLKDQRAHLFLWQVKDGEFTLVTDR
jgi:branched-chain amino acid transport system substrate-binding protein